jgi:hypothetical protein
MSEYSYQDYLDEISENICDMVQTDLCDYYRKKKVCHYKITHGVTCPISEFRTEEDSKK